MQGDKVLPSSSYIIISTQNIITRKFQIHSSKKAIKVANIEEEITAPDTGREDPAPVSNVAKGAMPKSCAITLVT